MIATRAPLVEELIRSDADHRAEFVRGERCDKPLPNSRHSEIEAEITRVLGNYLIANRSGKVLTEWHHRFGSEVDERIYLPDVAVVLAPRHQSLPVYADQASDIMIEIMSPGQNAAWFAVKIEFYLHNGAKRVWMIDPDRQTIWIFAPDRSPVTFKAGEDLTDDLLPGFSLPVASLFD
jgi:Uma2 family endonuclease